MSCASHLVCGGTIRLAVVWLRSHNSQTLIKVAVDDGLIQSETCRASNEKKKSNHKNFVHLDGSYAY